MIATPESERIVFGIIGSTAGPEEAKHVLEDAMLTPEDFAEPVHADLWRVLEDFCARGVPLDPFAIEASLGASSAFRRAGGRKWLFDVLLPELGQFSPIGEHARLIRDASLRRRAHTALASAASQVLDPELSAAEVLGILAETSTNLTTTNPQIGTCEGDIFRLAEQVDANATGRRTNVIPTGIEALDVAIGGLQPDILTMLGALPGVGKSAVLATIARNLVLAGLRPGIFSLEDERLWLTRRWMALESRVPVFHLAKKKLNTHQREAFDAAQNHVYELLKNTVIDDRPRQTPRDIAATSREMVRRLGCKAILIDHLGKMKLNRHRERFDLEIADALETILEIAKSEHVPVLMAGHLRLRPGLDFKDVATMNDFANSPAEVARVARVIITACRPSNDTLRLTIQKQNEGPVEQDIDVPLSLVSAMVDEQGTAS